jgi:hypothetical protein
LGDIVALKVSQVVNDISSLSSNSFGNFFVVGCATRTPQSTPAPFPTSTQLPAIPSVTSTRMAFLDEITVSNPTLLGRNLHSASGMNSPVVALLLPGDSAPAAAWDKTNLWVLVDYKSKQLWVYASQVSISAPLESLPIILVAETPIP